jgi:hypothetical protein
MQSVVETSIFTWRADSLLMRKERAELIAALARNPTAGDLIPGTGGVRKMRLAAGGQGRRAGQARRASLLAPRRFHVTAMQDAVAPRRVGSKRPRDPSKPGFPRIWIDPYHRLMTRKNRWPRLPCDHHAEAEGYQQALQAG